MYIYKYTRMNSNKKGSTVNETNGNYCEHTTANIHRVQIIHWTEFHFSTCTHTLQYGMSKTKENIEKSER